MICGVKNSFDVYLSFVSVDAEKPKLPDSFEEDTWLKLKLCINAVHTETPVGQSFEELYKV